MRRLADWLAHRPRVGATVQTLVLHATATDTLEDALAALRERGLSYHFLIDRDGEVIQLVPAEACAFHAGESLGPQGPAANGYSIGVSFVNRNDGVDPITPEQEHAVRSLVASLSESFPLRWVTTHAAIAPGRKDDPVGYDVGALASDCGLEPWPSL